MQSQLEALKNLQGSVAWTHDSKGLASFRSAVSATVSATQTFVQQSSQASGKEFVAGALYAASTASRLAVSDFTKAYYEERIFEPYLKFASAEEEAVFRRTEAQRLLAMEKARAEGTPQGDLRANRLAIEQLKDAGAHGASSSSEFQRRLDALNERADRLEKSVNQSGLSAPTLETDVNEHPSVKIEAEKASIIQCFRAAGITQSAGEGHGLPPSESCAKDAGLQR